VTALTDNHGPQACGRFEWERIVRRLALPMRLKFTAMVIATYADADGSRVKPGSKRLAAVTAQGESTVRKHLGALQEYGLLTLVSRGGGRGGVGKTSEFRLAIPVDLLARVPMLPATERPLSAVRDSPLAQGSAHSEGDAETPLSQGSAQTPPSTVDKPVDSDESPLALESGQSETGTANDRSETAIADRLSARFERMTARSSEQLPSHNQPLKAPTTSPDPAQPPTARKTTNDRCPVCLHPHAFLEACRPAGGDPP
jgi:hypothetical protein